MGCPLKPLLANDLTGPIEETLVHEGKMTSFYKRCVDDTCTNYYAWHNICSYFSSSSQLPLINEVHHKTKSNSLLPFLEMLYLNRAPQTEIKVYTKPTNTGLFLQEPCRHTRHTNDAWPYISELRNSGSTIQPLKQVVSGIPAKIHSWSVIICCIFEVHQSVQFVGTVPNPCASNLLHSKAVYICASFGEDNEPQSKPVMAERICKPLSCWKIPILPNI